MLTGGMLVFQATGAVLAYLTDEKRKHSSVLWVSLQDELVLEANGQIFCPREPTRVDQHICVLSSQTHEIQVRVFGLLLCDACCRMSVDVHG